MLDLSEESKEENIAECVKYFKRMAPLDSAFFFFFFSAASVSSATLKKHPADKLGNLVHP
jgi:hypothetical protein